MHSPPPAGSYRMIGQPHLHCSPRRSAKNKLNKPEQSKTISLPSWRLSGWLALHFLVEGAVVSLEVTIFMNYDVDYKGSIYKGKVILQLPKITNAKLNLSTIRCYLTYILNVMINKKKSDELGPAIFFWKRGNSWFTGFWPKPLFYSKPWPICQTNFFSYFLFTKEIARRESMMIEFAVIWAHGIHRKSASRGSRSVFRCFLALVDTKHDNSNSSILCQCRKVLQTTKTCVTNFF